MVTPSKTTAKPSPSTTPVQVWLFVCNLTTSLAWGRVALLIATTGYEELSTSGTSCTGDVGNAVKVALAISFIELFNCLCKFTRSPILAVLLFSCTRAGVEFLIAPMIPCGSWQHLLTVAMWGLGDFVRFGCFAADSALPGNQPWVKSIRFMIGPILFPIGAAGEMFMVLLASSEQNKPMLIVAAALWPVFFYPMYKQLLKQRRKHVQSISKSKTKEIKAV